MGQAGQYYKQSTKFKFVPGPKQKGGEKAEEKISVFWRVFGGTILSITALAVISAYQSLANGIHVGGVDHPRRCMKSARVLKWATVMYLW